MREIRRTAVLGAGVIGASWAALFLAAGRSVAIHDPAPGTERRVRDYVRAAWPAMTELGLTEHGNMDAITFPASAAEAVDGSDFIQENVPERLPVKQAVHAEIEPVLGAQSIVASSASGLTLAQMQDGWHDPSRLILGHPFNPPHLVPLVEIMGNARTAPDVLEIAETFYRDIGKVTIRLNKGLPGHVANRLQAAMWREAIHLVVEGVASVEDVDKAVWAGPGLRWAAMGPTTLFHLGAGPDGMRAFCDHFRDTFEGWWADLGQVSLTDEVIETIAQGVENGVRGRTVEDLAAGRDAMIVALQKAARDLR